jgi:hypothetical protein
MSPSLEDLAAGLASVLENRGLSESRVTVLERRANAYASTYAGEIVTCRLKCGKILRLLCKYGNVHADSAHDNKRGVAYEAAVYERVLQNLAVSLPRYYGAYVDPKSGETWLVLEHLESCLWLNKVTEPTAMVRAATWLGEFHAAAEAALSTALQPVLKAYDAEYFLGWAHRTLLFTAPFRPKYPWLTQLCSRTEEVVAILASGPLTIIHGEFYPENVLFCRQIVYPVDWESAAVAAGEIDLASLTERWGPAVAEHSEREYWRVRFPEASIADLARRLTAARLYLHLRWLGDRPEWTVEEASLWHFDQLRGAGERLGLI